MLLTILQQGPIPLSGYVICFIPLALVILGFIAAGVASDRHARRSYLRFAPSDEAPGVHIDAHKLPDAPLPSDTTIVNR